MCRMVGVVREEVGSVGHWLVGAPYALAKLARHDRRGQTHADGWGLSTYDDGPAPGRIRSAAAAFDDPQYAAAAGRLRGRIILAHARQGSVGRTALDNAHPFHYGRWSFCHNGTLFGFEQLAPRLEADLPAELTAHRAGQTDSELVFLWLLAALGREGLPLEVPAARAPLSPVDLEQVADVMRLAIQRLAAWSADVTHDAEGPAKLNFLLTEGSALVASRFHHDLVWREPAATGAGTAAERQVVVASEPLDDDPGWRELPNRSILTVDARLRTALRSF